MQLPKTVGELYELFELSFSDNKVGYDGDCWIEVSVSQLFNGLDRLKARNTKKKNPKWIKWEGGERPVDPDTKVKIERRDRIITKGFANEFRWCYMNNDHDIVAYRVIEGD